MQSCYIPWKGYFDLINLVDEFILYDDRQYTRRDWRNRNRIKTPQGVAVADDPSRGEGALRAADRRDAGQRPELGARRTGRRSPTHTPARRTSRSTASGSSALYGAGDGAAAERRSTDASSTRSAQLLGIRTTAHVVDRLRRRRDEDGAARRPLPRCRRDALSLRPAAPATTWTSRLFEDAGIELEYIDYSGYPEYEQLHPPFEHDVTVLDLLFNVGTDAPRYMKSFATRHASV